MLPTEHFFVQVVKDSEVVKEYYLGDCERAVDAFYTMLKGYKVEPGYTLVVISRTDFDTPATNWKMN